MRFLLSKLFYLYVPKLVPVCVSGRSKKKERKNWEENGNSFLEKGVNHHMQAKSGENEKSTDVLAYSIRIKS